MFYAGLVLFLAGALLFALAPRKVLHYLYLLYAAGSGIAAYCAARTLYAGVPGPAFSFRISPFLALGFNGGPLQMFFLLVLAILAASVSLYSAGYMRESKAPRVPGILYGLFIMSMGAVFLSADALSFLISWEAMSLVSYFLVVSETASESARSAGLTYATMTHIGTAFIIAAFMLAFSATGSLGFSGMAAGLAGKSAALKSVIFVLAFIGFGTKAGVIPLHIWLPRAHPAAPSNVSALMSGVMIKAGIYGILLVCLGILGGNVAWWGIAVLAAGGLSSVLGVLYALMEHDIKRLLAYHSVENIGIILLGTGAAILFYSFGQTALAGIALAAALYHTMNHAIFKGLLFLGAGSAVKQTRTKNMEEMGGLIKRMPATGLFFLVGSTAICALPPFNGFVSEWLTFQALILGSATPLAYSKVISLLGAAALALTGALAAACFVKAFGISFLGLPRSRQAAEAGESGLSMTAAMGFLALLCLLFGVAPGIVLGLTKGISFAPGQAAGAAVQANAAPGPWPIGSGAALPVTVAGGFSSFWPAAILVVLLAGSALALLLVRAGGRKTGYGPAWDCGIKALSPRMQYTATAFTKPLRTIFRTVYMPRKELRISYSQKPLFVRALAYHSDITPFFETYIYGPFVALVGKAAMRIRNLQSGSLNLYLGYIMLTLIGLLIMWA
ncbi:MAG: proton-conducting transporter membrane subunit [Nitrospiraceae bacterium]|nr:proton-conducting transporter membrane subunit [Nitrospiraceae bacterium]